MTHLGYTLISPFVGVMPRDLRDGERPNAGDGLIQLAIQRMLQPLHAAYVVSSRLPLSDEQIERINDTQFAVLGGTNQLKNDYSVVPGLTPRQFEKIRVPVIPFGIGWKERPRKTWRMSSPTLRIIEMMHERLEYSSWRCPHTVHYLTQNLPHLAGKALMTGCPVQIQEPILEGRPFTTPSQQIAVAAIDHGKFWEREKAILEFVTREFPNARRLLNLHQDARHAKIRWKIRHLWKRPRTAPELHACARSLGFEIFHSDDPETCFEQYRDIDGHFGSRLHAHLYLLGQAKASYLVRVDDRAPGMAEAGDFPLFNPATFEGYKTYDFERYRRRLREIHPVMKKFAASVHRLAGLPAETARIAALV